MRASVGLFRQERGEAEAAGADERMGSFRCISFGAGLGRVFSSKSGVAEAAGGGRTNGFVPLYLSRRGARWLRFDKNVRVRGGESPFGPAGWRVRLGGLRREHAVVKDPDGRKSPADFIVPPGSKGIAASY